MEERRRTVSLARFRTAREMRLADRGRFRRCPNRLRGTLEPGWLARLPGRLVPGARPRLRLLPWPPVRTLLTLSPASLRLLPWRLRREGPGLSPPWGSEPREYTLTNLADGPGASSAPGTWPMDGAFRSLGRPGFTFSVSPAWEPEAAPWEFTLPNLTASEVAFELPAREEGPASLWDGGPMREPLLDGAAKLPPDTERKPLKVAPDSRSDTERRPLNC